jgi:hypothetical protein
MSEVVAFVSPSRGRPPASDVVAFTPASSEELLPDSLSSEQPITRAAAKTVAV